MDTAVQIYYIGELRLEAHAGCHVENTEQSCTQDESSATLYFKMSRSFDSDKDNHLSSSDNVYVCLLTFSQQGTERSKENTLAIALLLEKPVFLVSIFLNF